MQISIKPLAGYGTSVQHNPAQSPAGTPLLTLPGMNAGKKVNITIGEDTLSRHTLMVGGTGCGKTNLMFRMCSQILAGLKPQDVVIIFDSKGDYYKRFRNTRPSIVIGNSPKYRGESKVWNIFQEIQADGDEDEPCRLNAAEIAKSLFAQRMSNTSNAFFPSAAQDIFASLLTSICRDGRTDPVIREKLMNNKDLMSFLQTSTPEVLCDQLSCYDDLLSTASYIAGTNEQSQGVISEMYSVIRELFIGVFCGKGNFSIRKFVRDRGDGNKKVLFLEYDLSIGSILTPVYRMLIDLALKEIMGQSNENGRVFFFFDEFRLLPHLQHIDDAVNFGRSKGVRVFAGIQSIEQLYDLYGQSRGRNVAAGFSSVFAFHANDESTMKYMRELYGANIEQVRITATDGKVTEQIQQGHVIEDWVLSGLKVGQAVVSLPEIPPFIIQFDRFE